MWRMTTNGDPTTGDGQFYVSTFDESTTNKGNAAVRAQIQSTMGFDLWRSPDGWHFSSATTSGFGDMFNYGGRTMQSTPYGLFVGTANNYYGLNVFRNTPAQEVVAAPQNLQVDQLCGGPPVLSWQPGPQTPGDNTLVAYVIHRAPVGHTFVSPAGDTPFQGTYALTDTIIATVTAPLMTYVDATATRFQEYHYTVVAVDAQGDQSNTSNMVRWPSFGALSPRTRRPATTCRRSVCCRRRTCGTSRDASSLPRRTPPRPRNCRVFPAPCPPAM